jgi:hypothetical protein
MIMKRNLGILASVVLMAWSADSVTAQWQSTVNSFQSSYRFYGSDGTSNTGVGVRIEDKSGGNLTNVTQTNTGSWALTNLSGAGSPTVNVDWQGTFTSRPPTGSVFYDDFTVASSNSTIRQLGDEITANWYASVISSPQETAVNLAMSFGPQQNGNDLLVEGLPDIPVRAVRLELFESPAAATPVGSVIHSVEYANAFEVEPFLSVRNLYYLPVHFMASTGAFHNPASVGDHDDYAAMIGMVGDGVVRTLPAAGDFNEDGVYGIDDIDALTQQILEASMGATVELKFDVNGDGNVDPADGERWLANAGAVNNPSGNPFLPADGNLDGVVDGSDFILWNAHKFSFAPLFSQGDWNYDGVVDGSDFLLWNAHKFNASDLMAVPEPGSSTVLLVGLLATVMLRFRRKRLA